ncbi:N-6 DNA methylase [Streptomyces californicus]|uniref:N-6 DNA methylase n=1 Tax=Streptomyces californicus TaxID=67351 RepID=UPI0036CECFCF
MISSTLIKSIQDVMRQDQGVDGDAQRLSQLVWMIFLKILDDTEQELELMTDGYVPAIPVQYQWRAWAGDEEGLTGDDLNDFVNNDLFPALRKLSGGTNPRTLIVRGAFEDSYNYMKSGTLLRQVINKINSIDFTVRADRHQFNDLYEKLLKDLQSAGNSGEFYTPRALTEFVVEMVNPLLDERVFDPATGTGGFLANAIDHKRKQVKTADDEKTLQASIRGTEKKQLPHVLCLTNMILHGVDAPTSLRRANTLARPLRDYGPGDQVDVVVTNPPFGGFEEPGIEQNFPADVRTRETADLFLVLIIRLLCNGGRAGMILPDGFLFRQGVTTRVKERLFKECNVHTIVRIPPSAFSPYTDIATNLVFFTKGEATKETWYFEHRIPGHLKAYGKTNPIKASEFDGVRAWWGNREETDQAWRVPIQTIKDRGYNLDIANPNQQADLAASGLGSADELTIVNKSISEITSGFYDLLTTGTTLDPSTSFISNLTTELELPGVTAKLRNLLLFGAYRGLLSQTQEGEASGHDIAKNLRSSLSKAMTRLLGAVNFTTEPEEPIPATWAWARFGEVAEIASNLVNPGSYQDTIHVAPDNVEKATGRLLNCRTVGEDGVTSANHYFFAGQILYSKIRPNLSKVVRVDFNGLCSADMYPITPSIDVGYLHGFMLSETFVTAASTLANRVAMPKINQKQLANLFVPLPPESEQKQISALLEQGFTWLQELERLLERRAQLRIAMSDSSLKNYKRQWADARYGTVDTEQVSRAGFDLDSSEV